jgi:predicted Rossmann fold nucleotide-binding protein DprA/Smf involved in DNA uptake
MNRVKYYAGIGSRETPLPLKTTISYIANYLNSQGYILRSGGAPGADNMFEKSLSPDV